MYRVCVWQIGKLQYINCTAPRYLSDQLQYTSLICRRDVEAGVTHKTNPLRLLTPHRHTNNPPVTFSTSKS